MADMTAVIQALRDTARDRKPIPAALQALGRPTSPLGAIQTALAAQPLTGIAADARRAARQLAPHLPAIEDALARAAGALRDRPPISPPRAFVIPSHLDRLIIRKEADTRD